MNHKFHHRIFTNANQEAVEYKGEIVHWRVSAYAVVAKGNAVLLIKNKNEKLYDVPGGGVDLGETIEQALKRELIEEAGATAKIGKLLHLQEGFFKHANGMYYQTIQLFYESKLIGNLVTSTEGTTEFVDFVSQSDLSLYPLPIGAAKAVTCLMRGQK